MTRPRRAPRGSGSSPTRLRILSTVTHEDPGGTCLFGRCKRTDGLKAEYVGTATYTVTCPDHRLWDPEPAV